MTSSTNIKSFESKHFYIDSFAIPLEKTVYISSDISSSCSSQRKTENVHLSLISKRIVKLQFLPQ